MKQKWLDLIDEKWHRQFLDFIDTGEASEEFLAFMDRDPKCQRAVELAFASQAAKFEGLARSLRDTEQRLVGSKFGRVPAKSTMGVLPLGEIRIQEEEATTRSRFFQVLDRKEKRGPIVEDLGLKRPQRHPRPSK